MDVKIARTIGGWMLVAMYLGGAFWYMPSLIYRHQWFGEIVWPGLCFGIAMLVVSGVYFAKFGFRELLESGVEASGMTTTAAALGMGGMIYLAGVPNSVGAYFIILPMEWAAVAVWVILAMPYETKQVAVLEDAPKVEVLKTEPPRVEEAPIPDNDPLQIALNEVLGKK